MGFKKNGKLTSRSYARLVEDIRKAFEAQKIQTKEIHVSEGATDYRVTVWRK